MALSPTMKRAVRRVADLLGEFATQQGSGVEDWRLFFRVDPDWDRIRVIIVSNGFEGHDPYGSYAAVEQFLRDKLRDDPALFHAIGLVIRTFQQVDEGGIYAIGPDYFEVKPKGR